MQRKSEPELTEFAERGRLRDNERRGAQCAGGMVWWAIIKISNYSPVFRASSALENRNP